MPQLKYVGSFDEIEIPAAGVVVKHGESFDVADPDLAKALLAQSDNFKAAKATSKGA